MKGKLKKTLYLFFAALLLTGIFAVLPVHAVVAAQYLKVENPGTNVTKPGWSYTAGPPNAVGTKWFNFTTDTTDPGDKFYANVTIYNYTRMYTWQVKLTWNPAYLKVNGVWVPPDHFMAGKPGGFLEVPGAIDNVGGTLTWGGNLYGTDNVTNSGKGVVMCVWLEIDIIPDMAQGTFSCDIAFSGGPPGYANTFLKVLPQGGGPPVKGDFAIEDGKYNIKWMAPSYVPCFTVEVSGAGAIDPQHYKATAIGEIFTVAIKVDKVAAGWNIIGFSAALQYNTSVITYVSMTNGTWLDTFCEGTETTLYLEQHDFHGVDPFLPTCHNKIAFIAMILPGAGGYQGTYPSTGIGVKQTLVTFTFNATAQGIFPTILWTWLNITQAEVAGRDDYNPLSPMKVVNKFNLEVAHQYPPTNAYYEMAPLVLGRSIDLFIGAECSPYPAPFGGQGLNATADMFEPQKLVCMWALVLYNLWPVQSKPVTFEVIAPTGETIFVAVALTNETGYAFANFRIPWSCNMTENEKWLCHTFTIIASVDIACDVVKDWTWFHYDWRIRWVSVTTDKLSYKHCETIRIDVLFKSKSQQVRNVTITCVLVDELGVPHGFVLWATTVSGARWCEYKNYTYDFRIHVEKHVFAGTGKIIVNGLSCLPWKCGYAVVPQYAPAPEVQILAEWVP